MGFSCHSLTSIVYIDICPIRGRRITRLAARSQFLFGRHQKRIRFTTGVVEHFCLSKALDKDHQYGIFDVPMEMSRLTTGMSRYRRFLFVAKLKSSFLVTKETAERVIENLHTRYDSFAV